MTDNSIYARPADAIDCSRNPLDLRPAAEAILTRIEAARERLRDTDTPVVVLVGERHDKPLHKLMHIKLIQNLLEKQKEQPDLTIAAGIEKPHDMLGKILGGEYFSPKLKAKISALDRDGYRSLTSALACTQANMAPVTYDNALNYLRTERVPTRFIDLADRVVEVKSHDTTHHMNILDNRDPFTRELIEAHAPELLIGAINPTSMLGCALRNLGMAELGMRHIAEAGASVYVVQTGASHLFSASSVPETYGSSLHHHFTQAGAHVIPIYIKSENEILPYEVYEHTGGGCVISGLDDRAFHKSSAGEEHYLRHIIQESRLNMTLFNVSASADLFDTNSRNHCNRVLVMHAEQWADELYESLYR